MNRVKRFIKDEGGMGVVEVIFNNSCPYKPCIDF